MINFPAYFTTMVFIVTLILIMSEKVNRAIAAMAGAAILLGVKLINQESVIELIDFNTIGVLIGMMIVVSVVKRSGLFQYMAIKSAKVAKGDPWRIMLILSVITAVISAFLDNVTTVLLIAPVTLVITDTLKLNPTPFILLEIFSSNIGGTATLIGDPPNIMIGSEANLGFIDFIMNLSPVIIMVLIAVIAATKILYGRTLKVDGTLKKTILGFDEKKSIKSRPLLIKCLVVLLLIAVGFFFHENLGYNSASIALGGATLLLLASGVEPEEIFKEIEWPTIFFFTGLFIIVGTLDSVGIIGGIAKYVVGITGGNLFFTGIMILWMSAIISAFLDNIPFVATMIPMIKSLGEISGINIAPLWWALSLGACLGGNGTLIGASANVVAAGILEKHKNRVTFGQFTKVGFPIMLLSIVISTIYLIVFYLR